MNLIGEQNPLWHPRVRKHSKGKEEEISKVAVCYIDGACFNLTISTQIRDISIIFHYSL